MFSHPVLKRRLNFMMVPALCAAMLSYIGYHAFTGSRGLNAHERLDAETVELKTELAELVQERVLLQKQITLLRPDTLDPDMLDERVRAVLNFAENGELTFLRH